MSKIISFFTAFFLILQSPFLFILGRDGRQFGKAALVLEASSYAVGTEAIKVTLHNGTLGSLTIGGCSLQRWEGGTWNWIAPRDSVACAPYQLKPLRSANATCELTNYDPPLAAGRYRVGMGGGVFAEFTLVGLSGEVTLTTESETYPVGTREIKATLYNGSPARFDYTVGYRIDKYIDGEWVTVGPNLGFIALMQYLLPGCGETLICELSCNEPLEAGRYRIGVGGACGEFTLV